ncbi:hypothetical protein [Hirschia baltica]|uniref:Methyltransferase type 11 n=1 Tax=Hirschia baltica (strain ATCC 49814 / DSM 5838 / IFAM 1418) TaxID=582402 RepID=C6XS47_HIRBI|nr:hypothetical protein [Hirschia baltica]ACT60888.1 conserved hypothetical protein [Hirschia baltica ATCC 49814]
MIRETFLQNSSTVESLLEIGPGASPIFAGSSVEYFDVMSADELRQRFSEHGAPIGNVPEHIHHVSRTANLADVDKKFAFAASSHNIEHQPNLVKHLQDVANLLEDNGAYLLIIPDKRYCFDHFVPETTLPDILGAYLENRTVHSARAVVADRILTGHNDAHRHWAGDHGAPKGHLFYPAAEEEWKKSEGGYIDVHAWQFTPDTFTRILFQLRELGLNPFLTDFVGETPHNRFEFCARLVKAP